MASLDDLVKEVKAQRSATEDLAMTFGEWFEQMQRERLDRLEDRREAKKTKPASPGNSAAFRAGDMVGAGLGAGFAFLLNPLKALAPLLTGLTAVGAAMAGLRGWELSAIQNIDKITDALKGLIPDAVGKNINQAFLNYRATLLRRFGIDPKLPTVVMEDGKTKQLRTPGAIIRNAFTEYRKTILRGFGIGDDGKLIPIKGQDGFKPPRLGRFIIQLKSLFRPIVNAGDAMSDFFKGAFGQRLVNIGGKFGTIFKKILWPIGFLFSAFDGIEAFRNSDEEGLIARLGDGIGAFVGDFIGAPFDLIKSGINWIFDKIFNVKRDENGKVVGDGWADWASKKMSEFSFEETIGTLVSAPFKMVQGAVDWVKLLFTDPKAALDDLWETFKKAVGFTPIGLVFNLASKGFEWVKSKFSWNESEDDNSFDLTQYIKDTWQNVVDRVKQGFEDFGNWVSSIPAKLKLMAVKTIDAATPDWLIDMSDDIAAAEQAVRAFNTPTRETTGTSVAAASGRLDAGGGQVVVVQDNSQNKGGDTYNAPTSVVIPMSTEAPGTADVNNPFYGYHMMGQGYVNQ